MAKRVRWWEIVVWVLLFSSVALLFSQGLGDIALPWLMLLVILLLTRAFTVASVRILTEFERLVIFRLGRCVGAKGPGMVLVIPWIDRAEPMDLRERFKEVPHESCITKDNATIDVDFLFYWKVNNPELAVTQVQKLEEALGQLATGLLRAVIGDISLDQALAEREHINLQLQTKIDEVTEHWGVEVTTVEIREIVMPDETREIMIKQMAAERAKRATILEAEGYKQAQELRAQGDANALMLLNDVARQIDPKTFNLKYLETLSKMGEGEATKYVFPLEFTSLVRPLIDSLSNSPSGGQPASTSATASVSAEPKREAPRIVHSEEKVSARVKLDRELEDFGDVEQSRFVESISLHTGTPKDEIEIAYIAPGSAIVTLTMPERSALRLMELWLDGDPNIAEWKISDVRIRAALPGRGASQRLPRRSSVPELRPSIDYERGLRQCKQLLERNPRCTNSTISGFETLRSRLLIALDEEWCNGPTEEIRAERVRVISSLDKLLAELQMDTTFMDLCRESGPSEANGDEEREPSRESA
jgi:regulator of protease activity HflC (stomatin/prohibitin superfamily)